LATALIDGLRGVANDLCRGARLRRRAGDVAKYRYYVPGAFSCAGGISVKSRWSLSSAVQQM